MQANFVILGLLYLQNAKFCWEIYGVFHTDEVSFKLCNAYTISFMPYLTKLQTAITFLS